MESGGFDARALGLAVTGTASVRGGDKEANLRILDRLLDGEQGPVADVVGLNAAASLVVAGLSGDAREGLERARAAITDGTARATLDHWRSTAQALAGGE